MAKKTRQATAMMSLEANYARLKEGERQGTVKALPLASEWKFKTDPDVTGLERGWQCETLDDNGWETIRSDIPGGWVAQGHPGQHGYGWYRQKIEINPELVGRRRLCLFFGGIDKEAEVFINGRKAFVHDHLTTELIPGATWDRPFSFDAKEFLRPGVNLVAVRSFSWRSGAGMHRGAILFSSDPDLAHDALCRHALELGKLDQRTYDRWCFEYIPPDPEPDQPFFGGRIQRTMSLLAHSSPARRQTVRILFYGQSIVAGMPWRKLIRRLQETYPYADIVAENRAIGGWDATKLARTATQDLYPFYPDLVVFRVYGGEDTGELERILRNIRKYTTAEIMTLTHTYLAQPTEENEHSAQNQRLLAQKYNCELVEVREAWRSYLDKHKLPHNALLGDNIHPNPKGYAIMCDLAMRHFRPNTLFPGGWGGIVKTYEARRPLEERKDEITFTGAPWKVEGPGAVGDSPSSAMKLRFIGNRVDVVAFPCEDVGSAKIMIDGRAPSSFPELYACTKAMQGKGISIRPDYEQTPIVNRVTLGANPLIEDWTLRVTEVRSPKDFSYEVVGSVTGHDGVGDSKERFVSKSGRITIEPQDIVISWLFEYRKERLVCGVEGDWKVVPMFVDQWRPTGKADPGRWERLTLAQGLENREHTIEIIPDGNGNIPVKELIVHEPPLK